MKVKPSGLTSNRGTSLGEPSSEISPTDPGYVAFVLYKVQSPTPTTRSSWPQDNKDPESVERQPVSWVSVIDAALIRDETSFLLRVAGGRPRSWPPLSRLGRRWTSLYCRASVLTRACLPRRMSTVNSHPGGQCNVYQWTWTSVHTDFKGGLQSDSLDRSSTLDSDVWLRLRVGVGVKIDVLLKYNCIIMMMTVQCSEVTLSLGES